MERKSIILALIMSISFAFLGLIINPIKIYAQNLPLCSQISNPTESFNPAETGYLSRAVSNPSCPQEAICYTTGSVQGSGTSILVPYECMKASTVNTGNGNNGGGSSGGGTGGTSGGGGTTAAGTSDLWGGLKSILGTDNSGKGDQQIQKFGNLGGLVSGLLGLVFSLTGILMFLYALIGIFQYITAGGNKEGLAKARARITWAIVGFLFVVISFSLSRYISEIIQPVCSTQAITSCQQQGLQCANNGGKPICQ